MTNSLMQRESGVLHETQALLTQLFEALTDTDLAFSLPGNRTLGALCVEMGQVTRSYIDSFKTFKHDWHYAPVEAGMADSTAKLKAWFKALHEELEGVLNGLSEDDILKPIDRGGFMPPAGVQVHVYREGILIFGGKVQIYLNALGKQAGDQWKYWIGL